MKKMIEREIIKFDEETIRELWNGVYHKGSSIEIEGETYTHINKINTSC